MGSPSFFVLLFCQDTVISLFLLSSFQFTQAVWTILKVKLLLSVLVFTWYVLIVHWRYLDDDGFQDFQAYSLGEILMEHFHKVLIIVLFVCLFCMFVGFSSIYGASHCRH